MTLKIALVGPESSGKSTLATDLSAHFRVPLVEEYAREFLQKLDRPYEKDDLKAIAEGQIGLERKAITSNPSMIICDTNLVVIKVWSLYKYKTCSEELNEMMKSRIYDLQLLVSPDLPWKPDAQRENPHDRDLLFDMYEKELKEHGNRYEIIKGVGPDRLNFAIEAIAGLGIP